jgi:hypothetical protein
MELQLSNGEPIFEEAKSCPMSELHRSCVALRNGATLAMKAFFTATKYDGWSVLSAPPSCISPTT